MKTNTSLFFSKQSQVVKTQPVLHVLKTLKYDFDAWMQKDTLDQQSLIEQDQFLQYCELPWHMCKQAMVTALQFPNSFYEDSHVAVHRQIGMSLSWKLLNGPLAGLVIQAQLANNQITISLSVGQWNHYTRLLLLRPTWLKMLNHYNYSIKIKIHYVVFNA